MSKKDFTGGFNSLLGEGPLQKKETRGRKKIVTREISKSSQEGTKEGETRATFIVREDYLEKLKALAYWERCMLKEEVDKILREFLRGANVKPRPEEVRKQERDKEQERLNKKGENKIAKLPGF
jgi:hypothetical protein